MQRRRFLKLSGMALGGLAAVPMLGRTSDVAAAGGLLPGAPIRHILATLNRLLPLHPALQYGAVAEPDRLVRVLVQKTSRGADGNAIAASVGARNLEEFAFVKTHLFELKLSSVLDLVKNLNVLYISPDGPIQRNSIAATSLKTRYPAETNATQVWNSSTQGALATGAGTTVAVVDTGVATHPDLTNLVQVNVNKTATGANDGHGHGTHVAGIIGGRSADGTYIGMAPGARIVGVKIADDSGNATESDLLRGLQWCYDHRTTHSLDVVTLSVNTGFAESYRTSPVCAAVEQLWFNGVVVVCAAGNRGSNLDATFYAPANDPYVITVGALDDNQTLAGTDDTLAFYSSHGRTEDLIAKPDVIAPGRKIVSTLASPSCALARQFPDRITDGRYLRLSGTSMAAPVVAGAAALLLERCPSLKPDQVKYLLTNTGRSYPGMRDNAKELDALAALTRAGNGSSVPSANGGNTPNSGINLSLVGLGLLQWANAYWDNAYWDNAYWDTAYWDNAYWDANTID